MQTEQKQVEGEAQGDNDSLHKFFQHVYKGPRLAHVTKVDKKELQLQEGEDHFGVRRTSDSLHDYTG